MLLLTFILLLRPTVPKAKRNYAVGHGFLSNINIRFSTSNAKKHLKTNVAEVKIALKENAINKTSKISSEYSPTLKSKRYNRNKNYGLAHHIVQRYYPSTTFSGYI